MAECDVSTFPPRPAHDEDAILTADGWQIVQPLTSDVCCPPSLCEIDPCKFVCGFVQLLPYGPMWDEAKSRTLEKYQQPTCMDSAYVCAPCDAGACATMVDFAVYKARQTYDLMMTALWPALRESRPETAYETQEDWLFRLGWKDCIATACRDMRIPITPYEISGVDNSIVYCPPNLPDELQRAVNRGIALALTRLQMGTIKNLAGINWVIEPLHAHIAPLDAECDVRDLKYGIRPGPCADVVFSICNADDVLPRVVATDCPTPDSEREESVRFVQSYIDGRECIGGAMVAGRPDRIYPAVLAAECIVRTLLPDNCKNNLFRKCCTADGEIIPPDVPIESVEMISAIPVASDCETLAQTPTLRVVPSQTPAQMADNHTALDDDATWWDDTSYPVPNYDTGEIIQLVNDSRDYDDPSYITNRTHVNVISPDGASTVSYYPGVYTDAAQSTTHYYAHDDIQAVDRYNGDFWAIVDWWNDLGSTLVRCVKDNSYQFQDPMWPMLYSTVGSPDTGLGATNFIVGFTATDIILRHEVDPNKDFKLEAVNKDTFVRHGVHYIDPGVGNINGSIETGKASFSWPNNFTMGPDGKLYYASWMSPAFSPDTDTFANGTRSFLYRFNPNGGAYDDVTPWSDVDLPITLPNPSSFGGDLTRWGIKHLQYDRVLDKVVVFFGGEDNDVPNALLGFHSYIWSWGAFNTADDTWVNNGQLPGSHYMDAAYVNCPKEDAVWCQVGWAPMDFLKNLDALPMVNQCQNMMRTMELVAPVIDGIISIIDTADPVQLSFQICIRDPAQDYAVVERFGIDDARYADLFASTGGDLNPQFLRSVVSGNTRPGDLDPFNQYSGGGIFRAYYLPNHKYFLYGSRAIDSVSFSQSPEAADWNSDNSQFYYVLEP